jgi:surface carbohydrate biosynthesis protein
MKRSPGPYLYLPIEISARELDSRLLLSAFALARGFEVVLGQKWLMHDNLPYMRPGVLVTKTLTATDARFMQIARRHGHRTASIDEEIPGLIATRQGLRWVMRAAVDAADLIFAAGDDHLRALIAKFSDRADRFRVVGNPRWDLLRPELRPALAGDAARLRREHGRFFLINTNFGLTNSAKGPPEAIIRSLVRTGRLDPENADDRAFIDTAWRLERANQEFIRDLLRELPRRFPDHRFVLRPHPGERLDRWREFAAEVPRLAVAREGAAVPWVMAAEALIHTNCTTGVEAFALGKPAICLRPPGAPDTDIYVSPRVNANASSAQEAIARLREIAFGVPIAAGLRAVWQREFDSFIAAREGPLAAQRIIDAISNGFFHDRAEIGGLPDRHWRPRKGYRGTIRRSRSRLSLMPEIDAAILIKRMAELADLLGISGTFDVQPCGDRMFHVYAGARRVRKPIPPAIVAFAHRLAKKGRALQPRRQPHIPVLRQMPSK